MFRQKQPPSQQEYELIKLIARTFCNSFIHVTKQRRLRICSKRNIKWHGNIPVEHMRRKEKLRNKKGRMLSSITSSRKITNKSLTRTVSLKHIILILNEWQRKALSNLQNQSLKVSVHTLASLNSEKMLCVSACYNTMGLIRKAMGMHVTLS